VSAPSRVLQLPLAELIQHPELIGLLASCNFPPVGSSCANSALSRPAPSSPAPPRPKVACAVSGGADSAALLILAVVAGCQPKAVYIDHQLRPESKSDSQHVAALASELELEFELITAAVEPGPNLEERARIARYSALPTDALVGHTADDQAETVIINLLRGAGISGLAGIRKDFRHPILELRRRQTERVCNLVGYVPIQDSMNQDMAFLRNRVRHQLLPQLSEISGRDMVPLLCRTADMCRDEDTLLNSLNSDIDVSDAKSLQELPEAELRWVMRRWITNEVGQPPDLASVQRMVDVVNGKCVGTNISGGHQVRRSKGRLSLIKSP